MATIAGMASRASSPSGVAKIMRLPARRLPPAPRATSRTGVPATTCAKRRADAAGGARQAQAQAAESRAIVANRRVVDHEIELAAPFDIDQPAAAFDDRLGLLAQRELHDGQPRAVAREPRDEGVGVVRKQEIADDDAQRAAAERQVGLFERRELARRRPGSARCPRARAAAAAGRADDVITRESATVDAHAQASSADSSPYARSFASVTAIERLTSSTRSMRGATSSRYSRTASSSDRAYAAQSTWRRSSPGAYGR